ncbi:MAG: hypothetical protein AB7E47_03735 [Desulfovibrionaceae bacterium]
MKDDDELTREDLEALRLKTPEDAARFGIEFLRYEYEEGQIAKGNGLLVWNAYQLALEYNLEIPEWVSRYLYTVAKALGDLTNEKRTPTGERVKDLRVGDRVVEALGLAVGPGAGDAFARMRLLENKALAFTYFIEETAKLKRLHGKKPKLNVIPQYVCARFREERGQEVTESQVAEWYKEFRQKYL